MARDKKQIQIQDEQKISSNNALKQIFSIDAWVFRFTLYMNYIFFTLLMIIKSRSKKFMFHKVHGNATLKNLIVEYFNYMN